MSISKTPQGRYKVRVKHDGKEVVRTRETHFEALKLNEELLAGETPSEAFTLGQALELAWNTRWIRQADGKKVSYPRGRLFCEYFGFDTPISEIKSSDLSRYKEDLAKKYTPATLNRRISAFNVMWHCASYEGMVSLHDKPLVKHERESEGRLRWLFPEEEKAIAAYFDKASPDVAYILNDWMTFSIDTGIRTAESLVIAPEHIREGVLTVESKIERGDDEEDPDFFTKNARSRVIPLTPRAMEIANRRCNMNRTFSDLTYGMLKYHYNKCREELFNGEKEITPYITRHTCASRLVQGGMSLEKIAKWMGHSSSKVTARYAKMSSNDIVEGRDILNQFVS